MALETLKDVEAIRGFKILQTRPLKMSGDVDWDLFDEQRKDNPIYVDHDVNMISFRVQNGPIKEVGVNGCQVDTIIATAKHIIEKLNEQYPCCENSMAVMKLEESLMWLSERTRKREERGVEGTSNK